MNTLSTQFNLKCLSQVGGATGLIGDPSGRSTERTLLKPEELKRNVAGISKNLQNFLQFSSSSISSSASSDPSSSTPTSSSSNDALLLNNYDWHGKMTAVEFLRDIGKFFRVGVMLSKDSVKRYIRSKSASHSCNVWIMHAHFTWSKIHEYTQA